ncbi:MAG: hypothetical protein US31_C0015G0017 [Berkelbacteria bacterium GW2011_GWA1_36_9]|uniref:Uncharacterized protein n=1 Tax=Berkelbacteria bacterium GW2011_GWA1_36_9 TaxID=1618331 RepID=A0A0G0IPA2_9BACT|nr:MAG: hypothetical protein US31_C0015G0017 [Berkelbacteria bacterium GW2011_GWA1_36_9]
MSGKIETQSRYSKERNVKRVALVNPPYSAYLYTNEKGVKSILPPLNLLYLHAYIRDFSEARIFDGETYDSLESLVKDISDFNPDLIGYTSTTPTYPTVKRIANSFLGGPLQIIGGVYATVADREVARDFDVVVRYEGEDTLKELIEGKNLREIQGLTFLEDGQIVITPNRPFKEDLDSLPVPSWDIIDFDKYQSSAHRSGGKRFGILFTTRGCYFSCKYCSTQLINGPKIRRRSPEKVGEEIGLIKDEHGISHFQVWDDTFTLEKKRLTEFCRVFKERGITFDCNTRPDCFTKEDARLMKESGCRNIFFGVESGSDKILDYLGRPMKRGIIEDSFRYCQQQRIRTTASFIIGSPSESEDTLKETLELAKRLKSDHVLFNVLTPHKGTEIYSLSIDGNLLKPYEVDIENYPQEPVRVPMIENINGINRDEINAWKMRMYRDYYLRASYIFQQLRRMGSLDDLSKLIKIMRTYSK